MSGQSKISGELAVLVRELGIGVRVGPGAQIAVRDLTAGRTRDYAIAASSDIDIDAGEVSPQSAVGSALIGAREGDEVTARLPGGERRLKVSRIRVPGSEDARRLAAWILSPGGTAAARDGLPWVFVADLDMALRQVRPQEGRRTVAVKAPWALVAAASDTGVEPLGGEQETIVDTLRLGAHRVYRVRGKVRLWTGDCPPTVIETGVSDGQGVEFKAEGERWAVGRAGAPVFLGRPAMREWQDGTAGGFVPEQDLEWMPDMPGAAWRAASPPGEVRGCGLLRHARAGTVLRCVHVCVLPAGARMELRPSSDPMSGEIVLKGFGDIEASVRAPAGVVARNRHGAGACRIEITAGGGPPPREVVAAVDWRSREGPLGSAELTIPFPGEHVAFFDARGKELPPGSVLVARQLAGARVQAVTAGAASLEVQGRYAGADRDEVERRCAPATRELPAVGPGHHWLDLAAFEPVVESAFARGEDLDGGVELLVRRRRGAGSRRALQQTAWSVVKRLRRRDDRAGPASTASIVVKRFDLSLEQGAARSLEFRLDAASRGRATARDLATLAVAALPLLDPELAPVALPRAGDHSWRLPEQGLGAGPHLIVGRQGEWQRLRPIIWHAQPADLRSGPETSQPRTAEEAYASASTHDEAAAAEAFRSVVRGMSESPGNDDWQLAFGYLRETSLPVQLFPLLQALAETPQACAMAAVVADDADFDLVWERMEAFRFAWDDLPLNCWKSVFRVHALHWREAIAPFLNALLGHHALEDGIRSRIERVSARLGGSDEAFEQIRAELTAEARAGRGRGSRSLADGERGAAAADGHGEAS